MTARLVARSLRRGAVNEDPAFIRRLQERAGRRAGRPGQRIYLDGEVWVLERSPLPEHCPEVQLDPWTGKPPAGAVASLWALLTPGQKELCGAAVAFARRFDINPELARSEVARARVLQALIDDAPPLDWTVLLHWWERSPAAGGPMGFQRRQAREKVYASEARLAAQARRKGREVAPAPATPPEAGRPPSLVAPSPPEPGPARRGQLLMRGAEDNDDALTVLESTREEALAYLLQVAFPSSARLKGFVQARVSDWQALALPQVAGDSKPLARALARALTHRGRPPGNRFFDDVEGEVPQVAGLVALVRARHGLAAFQLARSVLRLALLRDPRALLGVAAALKVLVLEHHTREEIAEEILDRTPSGHTVAKALLRERFGRER
jgi:hypothetical protein